MVTVLWVVSIEIGKMLSLGCESPSELLLYDWGMQYMYRKIFYFKILQNEEILCQVHSFSGDHGHGQ